jgi:alpha-galactosidase
VNGWTNQHYHQASTLAAEPSFWSYQSGSYEKRPDWVLPLKPGFKQENFLGMNDPDYGGGTPVSDVWCRDVGIAVGHVEMAPKLVSLPVEEQGPDRATVAVEFKQDRVLKPGATLKTFRTFAAVHRGDYFQTLRDYRDVMVAQGVRFDAASDSAFQPIWCAWGYVPEDQAQPDLQRVAHRQETRLHLGHFDDGWQTAQGDWLRSRRSSRMAMRTCALVDKIHAEGFKAQLWGASGHRPGTELVKNHPEWLPRNADGKQKISYWNLLVSLPDDRAVIEYHKAIVRSAIKDWGFRRAQTDGQHMNGASRVTTRRTSTPGPSESGGGMPKSSRLFTMLPAKSSPMPWWNSPMRHRLLLFYSAVPEHVSSVRSHFGLAGAHQGKTLKALARILRLTSATTSI